MITTRAALDQLISRIDAVDRVGIDTEADSLHCYREKVCLVQVGLPDGDELVDPLADVDLSAFLEILSRKELVLHGADFDLRMLYRLGLSAPGKVFDTMVAARLASTPKFGYSTLVAEHFDVKLPKGSQKANWARRPLSEKMEQYARNDTHYLLRLADLLERRLGELGRLTWLQQWCERSIDAARVVRQRDANVIWRVKGSNVLGPRASAVLRALWHWREDEASQVDLPPFRVLSNEEMVKSAGSFADGKPVVPRGVHGARRERFERVAKEALDLDQSEWPGRPPSKRRARLSDSAQKRFDALKKRRDRVAKELALDTDMIAARAAMERIATLGDEGMNMMLPWQQELLRGDD